MNPEDPMLQRSERERLEARMLAMLLGESDREEEAALQALLADDAELRAYRERTAHRLGLMEKASREKAELEIDPLRLDEEKRVELEKLLAEEETDSEREGTITPFEPIAEIPETKTRRPVSFLPLAAAAAVVLLAGIMIWSGYQEHDQETIIAYADEQTPIQAMDGESPATATPQESRNGKTYSSRKDEEVNSLLRRQKTEGTDSTVHFEELSKLTASLVPAVDQKTSEILDQRLADDIAAINDSGQLQAAQFSSTAETDSLILDEITNDGFAFAERLDQGGLALIEGRNLRYRDSSAASPEPNAPMSVPVIPQTITSSPFRQKLAGAEGEFVDEDAVAAPAYAPPPKSVPSDAPNHLGLARSDSRKNQEQLAKDNTIDSEEKDRSNRRAVTSRENKFDQDKNTAALASGASFRKVHPAGGIQDIFSRKESDKSSQLRSISDGAKKEASGAPLPTAPATTTSEAESAVEGFAVTGDLPEEAKRGTREPKGLHVDLATPPPPLPIQPNPERIVAEQPLSSFNWKTGHASFDLAHASIQKGDWPASTTIRSEEFLNAFDDSGPVEGKDELLSFRMERSQHPFANDRQVLRLSIGAAPIKNPKPRPLNLVIALDNSSSMKRGDRLEMAQKALYGLARGLTSDDRVSLITFADQPKLRLNHLPGDQLKNAISEISQLGSEKETNLGLGLDLSYAVAQERFLPKGNNRVLLLSDGGVNLGEKDPRALQAKVDEQRNRRIVLDCIGLGAEGYQDQVLETISRQGRYFFINKLEDIDDSLVSKITSSLHPAYLNLKVQVAFNSQRVEIFRQVGFKKAQLRNQYFDEKSIGGNEIAGGESGDALYIIKVNPTGKGNLGLLRLRFTDLKTGDLQQREWPLPYESAVPAFANAGDSLRLTVHATAFAEWLSDNPYGAGFRIERSIDDLQSIRKGFPDKTSIDRLSEMMIRSRSISR